MTWWVGVDDFEWTSEVQSNGRCVSTYMYRYLVRTDAATFQTAAAVAAAVGITRGSPLTDDTNAICKSVKITGVGKKTRAPHLAYYATYVWSTDATLPDADDDDPTTTRTIWSVAPEIQTRYVIKDKNGDLIRTTAGNPYDGGIPVEFRLGSVRASRMVDAAGYDKAAVLANSGKLNSTTFLGGAAGTVQVDISAQEKYEGGYHYWAEEYVFSYDPAGWQPKPASVDFFQRQAVGSDDLVRILNSDLGDTSAAKDDPVNEPQPLDEDGILVPIGSRPASCHFVEVDYYETMDFTTFGL